MTTEPVFLLFRRNAKQRAVRHKTQELHSQGDAMSGPLIALTGLIYLFVAADLAWRGNTGLAIAYAGYAAANVGLYMVAIK